MRERWQKREVAKGKKKRAGKESEIARQRARETGKKHYSSRVKTINKIARSERTRDRIRRISSACFPPDHEETRVPANSVVKPYTRIGGRRALN